MGIKGDKLNQDTSLSAELFLEKLSPIGNITMKKMFGGYGIFHDGKMFGIVNSKGQCYLKADDSNRTDFEQKDAHQHSRMPYYSVPNEIFDNNDDLILWAQKSIAINQ